MLVNSVFTKKIVFYACCFLAVSSKLRAQEYSYVPYNVQQGLAGSVVYHAVQDKEGFIWFATETGLSRFDGTNFKNFFIGDGLPDNEILRLYVDSRNRIWIMPFRATICYYQNGVIHNQSNDSLLKKIHLAAEVIDVLEDKAGNILLQQLGSMTVITTGNEIKTINSFNNGPLRLFFSTPDIMSGFSIAAISPGGFHIHHLEEGKLSVQKTIFTKGYLRAIGALTNDWEIFEKEDSFKIVSKTHNNFYFIKPEDAFLSVSVLNDSLFFLNTLTGARLYSWRDNIIKEEFLKHYRVSSVLKDSEDNYWFTTLDHGVFRLGTTGFKTLFYQPEINMQRPVYSIRQFNGNIYAGSDKSTLFVISRETGKVRDTIKPAGAKGRIISIQPGRRDDFFVGADNGLFHVAGNSSRHLTPNRSIKDIYDEGDELMASTNTGIMMVNKDNLSIKATPWENRVNTAIRNGDTIYVGTVNGFYTAGKDSTLRYAGDRFPLLANRITAIRKAGNGITWFATHGAGIVGLMNNTIAYHITTNEGLASNTCRTLFTNGNTVWVGTDRGLNKIVFGNGAPSITRYGLTDGLPDEIVYSVYVANDKVYVGTSKGLTFFYEKDISSASFCRLKLLEISVAGKPVTDSLNKTLLQKNTDITFSFAGISFKSAGDILYQYRLEGLDTGWKTTRQGSLSYPSLPSGQYNLVLTAFNKSGVQSNTLSIPFTIQKSWEEETGVRVLFFVGAILAGWLITWFVIKRIRRQEKEKTTTNRRIMALEQMALRSQMNPHFIFNSLNSIQQFVIDKDIAGANRYIAGFSRLIRQTLDNSSKEKITIAEEIRYLSTYLSLEKIRMEDAFSFSIITGENIPVSELVIPPMLLQPYVENSIRHGIRYRNDKNGKITVSMKLIDKYVVCTIEDNGIGRQLSGLYKGSQGIEYQSKGMSLTAERIKVVNETSQEKITSSIEDIQDENNVTAGTKVTIRFPIEYNH